MPQINSHLTAKLYVGNAIDESSSVRNNQDNEFNNFNLTKINSNSKNIQALNDIQVTTESEVDQFNQENERSRRDLGNYFYDESNNLVKNSQDDDFKDENLMNNDSVTVNGKPTSDNEI